MAASAKHTHSIHIDAPVEKVFGYLEDPAHFLASFPEENHVTLDAVNRNPDGTALTMSWDASRLTKMLDAVFFHTDKKEMSEALAKIKQAVEALP